jgi:hypothetical protein
MILTTYITVILDILIATFFFWRVTRKEATLWKEARAIYWWIAINTLYHAIAYGFTLVNPLYADLIRHEILLPLVPLFSLNIVLVAIIHWRGGHIL